MALRNNILTAFLVAFACLALAACEKPQDKEARYLKRGNEFFAGGEYEKARLEYKNAARIMPTDAEPRYRMGLVDEAEGDVQNAFANFVAAEQQNGHFRPALLKIAQYLTAAEQYDQAEKRLGIVLKDAPDDPEAHALHAAQLLKGNKLEEAEKEARFALGKDPANISATSVLSGVYAARNEDAKALGVVDEGIAHNPGDMSLLLLKVALYERASNLDKIAETYRSIFRLAPKEARFRSYLSQTYLKAGKPDKAEAALRDGVSAMPDDWEMKRELVYFLSENRGLAVTENEIHGLMQAYPKEDRLYFWMADLYIAHDATEKAAALLEQVVEKNQDEPAALNARTSLARLRYVKGDRALAEKLVAAVLERDPGNQEALLVRARLEMDQGRYQDVVTDTRTILRDNPHAIEAYQLLAETLLLQGRLDLATDTQSQLVEAAPLNSAAKVRLAQMYALNGDIKRARELLALVTKADPDYPIGWESTARIAIIARDWPAADAAIKTLDALKDQHMTATFLKGQEAVSSGRIDDAIPLYTEVINASPSSPLAEHAIAALVEAYAGENRLADAVPVIRALKGDTPYISSALGESLSKLGRDDEAAAAFDKAIAANTPFPEPYLGRAQLYRKTGNFDQAIAVLKKAQATVPSDIRAPMLEALLFSGQGKPAEAIAIYDGILARNPDADTAANNLAEAIADYQYTDQTALEKARQIAERFAGSSDPELLDTLGWVYFREGNLQQAETIMERVRATRATLPPEVHYHYGCLLLKVGRQQQARAELQQAVAAGADYSGLNDAKKLLSELN